MLQAPLSARFVRFHPVCWHGNSMAMRAELFACSSLFAFDFLRDEVKKYEGKRNLGLVHKNSNKLSCTKLLQKAHKSFGAWTEGMDGSGQTYQTEWWPGENEADKYPNGL